MNENSLPESSTGLSQGPLVMPGVPAVVVWGAWSRLVQTTVVPWLTAIEGNLLSAMSTRCIAGLVVGVGVEAAKVGAAGVTVGAGDGVARLQAVSNTRAAPVASHRKIETVRIALAGKTGTLLLRLMLQLTWEGTQVGAAYRLDTSDGILLRNRMASAASASVLVGDMEITTQSYPNSDTCD